MNIKLVCRNLFLLFVTTFICGCTVTTFVYIKNNSSIPKEVFMTKRDKIITEFFYTTNSVRINEKLAGQLEKTLQSFPVNDSVYSIVIPPHSILLLDKTHNFVSQKFTSVIINNRELIEDRFMYTAEGSIKEKEGLTFVSYYDIY